jgi:hypothetical protein
MPEVQCGLFPIFTLYTGIHLTTEETSRNNISQGSQNVPNWTVLGTIFSVNLASNLQPTLIGLLTSATLSLRLTWLGTTVGQWKYLPSCQTKGFPTPLTFESKLRLRLWLLSAKNSQILVHLPVTNVPRAPVAMRRHSIIAPAASWHGYKQQTSRWSAHSSQLDRRPEWSQS